jgi:hypothetical protein
LVPMLASHKASISPEMLAGPSNWMDIVLFTASSLHSTCSQSNGYESSSQSPSAVSLSHPVDCLGLL